MTSEDDMSNDLLAAEFALGLLSEPELGATRIRVARDPGFAAAVEAWRERFATLGVPPAVPPADLWRRIEMRLAVNDEPGVVRRWKWATAGMGAVAAALLAAIVLRPAPVVPVAPVTPTRQATAPLLASVSGKSGDVLAIAFDRDTRVVRITPSRLKAGVGDAELWVIPAHQTAPVAIAVIDAKAPTRLVVDARRAALITDGATFAISLEPKGGSPTSAPTGPVVATGVIVGL